ncbi:MAG: hypothetical protein U0269_11120 [Polyangiales bacterium]
MNRHSAMIALVALSAGACLPERFRSASDAADDGASRDDGAAMPDRSTPEASADVAPIDDVVSMDSIEDSMSSLPDARPDALADALADATIEAGADAVADARPDAAVCAPSCSANSACVAGACVARSCLGVRETRMAAGMGLTDGDYTIDPDGVGAEAPFTVYCADLATVTPREYLPVEPLQNLLRTLDSNTQPPTSSNDCGVWETRWSKVRLLIDTTGASPKYAIDSSDFRFTSEIVDPRCTSGRLYTVTRTMMTNNPYHRIYGVSHACEYRSLNQFFRSSLRNTGFRFPSDRVSRYKIENYSSGQANTFARWEGAYGYVVSVDAQCGSIVPVEWDRGAPDEPAADPDGTPPTAQSLTWRIPIVRAATPSSDPAPGASCANPIVTAPIGSDLRRSGLFQSLFSALPGMAPTGASCQSAAMPAEAVWLSVEVPAMSQRRLVAEASNVDPAILRVVNACGGDCSQVSAPSTVPNAGTSFVILDNSTNPAPRTFYVAASARSPASMLGTGFMNFVVQRVDVPACNPVVPGSPGGLAIPSLNGTTVNGRRLTLDWSLGTCATGAYAEVCADSTCSVSFCSNGGRAVPCSYHMPAMSPRFDINFRTSGTYYVRLRSLRFWIPGAAGEPVYGSEVLTPTTTMPQMVVIP